MFLGSDSNDGSCPESTQNVVPHNKKTKGKIEYYENLLKRVRAGNCLHLKIISRNSKLIMNVSQPSASLTSFRFNCCSDAIAID